MNIGSLTLNAGSILNYEFGGNADLINIGNPSGLTINGGGIDLFDTSGTNQFTTPGTYRAVGLQRPAERLRGEPVGAQSQPQLFLHFYHQRRQCRRSDHHGADGERDLE